MKVSCVLCIAEGTQVRKFMVFLQSCTVSLPVLLRSCSESSVPSVDAYGAISVKREDDSDIDCQEEEIPIAISFPTIKCEQDEVSYVSVSARFFMSISRNANCHSSPPHLCPSLHRKSSTAVKRNFLLFLSCVK